MNIKTVSDEQFVNMTRDVFNLNVYPWITIDDDLLKLAFTPVCVDDRFKREYGTCNHQSLETYGDQIIYMVILDIAHDYLGLSVRQGLLTIIKQRLGTNKLFTDIMLSKNACNLIRANNVRINREKHNVCADSFESLIGAMFVHCKKENLDYIKYIKIWIINNTNIPQLLSQIGRIYINKETDIQSLHSTISNRPHDEYYEDVDQYVDRIVPYKSIIVNNRDTLKSMYDRLGWVYRNPIRNNDIFYMYQDDIPIGFGNTTEEAIESAIDYLDYTGYIYFE